MPLCWGIEPQCVFFRGLGRDNAAGKYWSKGAEWISPTRVGLGGFGVQKGTVDGPLCRVCMVIPQILLANDSA